ncbi:MAG TPA: pitrilysin family protein [Bacteroidota bacterium]|jgi:predicted Zn-dependent peptidase|nr:pitrilysin family protein [Bacteroidota bacterium]
MNTIIRTVALGVSTLAFFSSLIRAGDDVDRTKRPVGKPAPKVALPQIQKATLKNGLKILLVEHHELPTAAFNLVIQAGSDHDPVTQPGIASVTADLLDEGTKKRDALQISEGIVSIGASFGTNSSLDGSSMTLSTLTKHLEKALDIFTDVLVNPTFPEKDFERIRKTRLAGLMQQRDQPPVIANNAYSYLLYGPNHPYGNNPSGSEASLKSMKTDDLKKFYQTYYRPNNATLVVVGDVRLDDITSKLEPMLSGWQEGSVPAFSIPEPKAPDKMRVYLVDKPGAPQSEVRIGYPALARSTPDFFPVELMNRVLGGQFSSRINLNLREKHGYTYGARSGFGYRKGVGPFTAQGGIVTEKSDSAMREFLNEINAMREKGVAKDELEFVKKGLTGNFALSFETPVQIAGSLQNIVLYSLPENYYNNYLQNIESVTLDDVNRVAKQYLDASKMAMVVVGDLSKIKDGIAAQNFGEVILCDLDGKPLPFIETPKK